MNNRQNDFVQLVDRAVRDSKFKNLRHAIEKELLIYDILFCLEQHNLLDNIVFQGGTLLRLGHGGERLSEDLDFAAGANFSLTEFSNFKLVVEEFFHKRYGLTVEVKEPRVEPRNDDYDRVTVHRWRVNATMYPERKDLPKQRVKFEVANVPAHTKEIVSIRAHYDFLPDGYDDVLIVSETLREVMADKLISLPANTRYIRYRDIWDLYWLVKRRTDVDTDLVEQKIIDYQLSNYADLLNRMLNQLPNIVKSAEFHTEMRKLLANDVYEYTLQKEKFRTHMLVSVQELFEIVRRSLN